MATHHMEVNVKGFKNAVHSMQWMRLLLMMMLMWNGSEEDGNVGS
jgi:hypothetical protein